MRKILPKKVTQQGRTIYRLYLGSTVDAAGKRKRHVKSFSDYQDALDYAREHNGIQRKYKVDGMRLSDAEAYEWAKAKEILPEGVSLIDVAREWSERRPKAQILLEDLARQCLEQRRNANLRARTIKTLHYTFEAFLAGRRHIRATDVTQDMVEDWVNSNGWSAQTRRRHLGDLRTLFNFGMRRGHLTESPLDGIMFPKVARIAKGIYSVEECRKWLEAARVVGGDAVAFVALGLFAGLRSSEPFLLGERGIHNGHVFIPAESKGWRTRTIAVSPVLMAWLKEAERLGFTGVFQNKSWNSFRSQWDAIKIASQVPFQQHGFRHSFATYWLTLNKNVGELREMLGHRTESVTWGHYIDRSKSIPQGEALAYFSLRPEAV